MNKYINFDIKMDYVEAFKKLDSSHYIPKEIWIDKIIPYLGLSHELTSLANIEPVGGVYALYLSGILSSDKNESSIIKDAYSYWVEYDSLRVFYPRSIPECMLPNVLSPISGYANVLSPNFDKKEWSNTLENLADQYLEYFTQDNDVSFIGGEIELQAMANIWRCRLEVKIFNNKNVLLNTCKFKPENGSSDLLCIELNMRTSFDNNYSVTFYPGINYGGSSSVDVFSAFSVAYNNAGQILKISPDESKRCVEQYLRNKLASKRLLVSTFEKYIFHNASQPMENLLEFFPEYEIKKRLKNLRKEYCSISNIIISQIQQRMNYLYMKKRIDCEIAQYYRAEDSPVSKAMYNKSYLLPLIDVFLCVLITGSVYLLYNGFKTLGLVLSIIFALIKMPASFLVICIYHEHAKDRIYVLRRISNCIGMNCKESSKLLPNKIMEKILFSIIFLMMGVHLTDFMVGFRATLAFAVIECACITLLYINSLSSRHEKRMVSALKTHICYFKNNYHKFNQDEFNSFEYCGVERHFLERLSMCEKKEIHAVNIQTVNVETKEYLKHIITSAPFNKKAGIDNIIILKDIIDMLDHIAPNEIIDNTPRATKLSDYAGKVLFSLKEREQCVGSQANLRHDSTVDCLDHLSSTLFFSRNIKSIRTECNANAQRDHQSDLVLQMA
jgi:hypothetical protein